MRAGGRHSMCRYSEVENSSLPVLGIEKQFVACRARRLVTVQATQFFETMESAKRVLSALETLRYTVTTC
jgi:hypothetical protein